MTSTVVTLHQDQPDYVLVANNVRAELSRQRWSGRKAAAQLGWSTAYMGRRLSGDAPFDVADLIAVAQLLGIPVARLFEGIGLAETRKAPTPKGEGRELPDLDSNQEPAANKPDGELIEIRSRRPQPLVLLPRLAS